MNRRLFCSAFPLGLAGFGQAIDTRPNIVLILADDLGYGDLGCYGGPVPTPNLDELAKQGMRFTFHESNSPVCTPARCGILTGKYPQRLGIPALTGVLNQDSTEGLEGGVTLADILRSQGYATAMVGKWHLGHAKPEFLPTAHGFDEATFLNCSVDQPPNNLWRVDKSGIRLVANYDANIDQVPSKLADEAVSFVSQRKPPFFLYWALTAPHLPLVSSKDFVGKSGKGSYYDVVLELDFLVGRLITAIKKFAPNTLVVFTSDNGPIISDQLKPGEQGSTGGLKGGKFVVDEGGIRMPLLVWWPDRVRPGVCDELTSHLDIPRTLAKVAGAAETDSRFLEMDGVDIWPLISQQVKALSRGTLLLDIRIMDAECAIGTVADPCSKEVSRFKIRIARDGALLDHPELYDLARDPSEQNDVAQGHPQVVAIMERNIRQQLLTFPKSTINQDLVPGRVFRPGCRR